jgi:hypothetical protein
MCFRPSYHGERSKQEPCMEGVCTFGEFMDFEWQSADTVGVGGREVEGVTSCGTCVPQ